MRLLLDTHALLWWQAGDSRLGDAARSLLADPGNDVLVSAVSLWEIVVKLRIGRIEADIGEIIEAIAHDGFASLDIRPAHLEALAVLPTLHRDPFDHLLIAQAMAEDATLVSDDRRIAGYPVRLHACAG